MAKKKSRVSKCIGREVRRGSPLKKSVAWCGFAGKKKRLNARGVYKRKKK
jgi:hypothetical protein